MLDRYTNCNLVYYKHNGDDETYDSEYFYRMQIGYDLSCEWMGETKNAITAP